MKDNCLMLAISFLSALLCGVAAASPYPGGVWQPGPAAYGFIVEEDLAVVMDDGVVLNASAAFPADLNTGKKAGGAFPVVVELTPYVTLAKPVTPMTFFAEHGYISVVVRVRGTGKSEGDLQLFGPRDRRDGAAVVDWAAHGLAGSDGRVAFVGCSFPAGMALGTAAEVGENSPLKAVVCANNGFESVKRQCWFVDGVPTTGFANYSQRAPYLYGRNPAAERFYKEVYADVMAGGDRAYDRAFWKERIPMELVRSVVRNGIPVLLWSGYEDILDVPALRTYTALQNAWAGRPVHAPMEKGQPVTPRYQMIMGGWGHASGLDLGVYLQWLDTWLKGIDTGIARTAAPLHLFEGGSGRWFNVPGYPLARDSSRLYLAAGGRLEPVPAGRGGAKLVWGSPSQKDGLLRFETAPFEKETLLAGPISSKIYASSSNGNLELLAALYDVAADGSAVRITKGVVLGSQREADPGKTWTDAEGNAVWPWLKLEKDDYLTPGRTYPFDVAMGPRQWALLPGHKLRLELTTQSPESVCPPTGRPPENGDDAGYLTEPQKETLPCGVYTVTFGADSPSALNLPIVPAGSFKYLKSGVLPTAWSESFRTFRAEGEPAPLPLEWR